MSIAGNPQSRRMLADEVRPLLGDNAANSIRDGSYANAWTVAALGAIDKALRTGIDDDDDA